jgi:hypothetical protein
VCLFVFASISRLYTSLWVKNLEIRKEITSLLMFPHALCTFIQGVVQYNDWSLLDSLINLVEFYLKIRHCHVSRSPIILGNKFGLDNMKHYVCDGDVVRRINLENDAYVACAASRSGV